MKSLNQVWARREFLRDGARYAALAAVAAVTAVTVRPHSGGPTGQRCENAGPCGGCPEFGGCGLPQARSIRREGNIGG
jgi:hypothetical protein